MNYYSDKRKVALIGAGSVGMSFAFALMGTGGCDELVIIDIDKKRAEGEAMDLNHGLSFSSTNMKIYSGSYSDLYDADIAVICAGVPQKPGEDRISLLKRNEEVFDSFIDDIVDSGFNGIFLVASNPVDIMTYITRKKSGFPASRVIGTGTTLDTARLRYLLGSYFGVDPKNVHAYVMGEHGDSEFVPWSQAYISTKSVLAICGSDDNNFKLSELYSIEEEVRTAAQKIIEAKRATYYGIAMSLVRIVKAIFGNEKSILTVSALLSGEYSKSGIYAGVPAVISRNGIERIIVLDLNEKEKDRMIYSCDYIRSVIDEMYGINVK